MPDASRDARRHRLVIASNRGPVTFRRTDSGRLAGRRGGGGLVTALGGLASHHDVTWVAHGLSDGDVDAMATEAIDGVLHEVSRDGHAYRLRLVGAPDETYDAYYNVIANPLLWFVMHRLYGFGYHPTITRGTHAAWRAYRAVNRRFVDALLDECDRAEPEAPAPLLLVQDYHLLLVPGGLRERCPNATIQYFQHVPWPGAGAWRCLPREWIVEVIESMLACDIVGLQTRHDTMSFIDACQRFVGATVDFEARTVTHGDRTIEIRDYPISVAVAEFEESIRRADVQRLRSRIRALRPGDDGTLIVRVDRTDPSKNIVRGFQAYELLLREHPELHGTVTMFCQLDPSRQTVPEYVRYLSDIMHAVEQVNDRYGTGSWQPVVLNADSSFLAAIAAYLEYDVLFVNPVADGMNLVSKEGPLVNERQGVVVLSEQAGSYMEFGEDVIAINPFDVTSQADALHRAITMPMDERIRRSESLARQVRTHDVDDWIDHQMTDVLAAHARI